MLLRKLLLKNSWLTQRARVLAWIGAATMGLSIFPTGAVHANITGSDTQNFNPTFSGHDFVTVYSSKTLGAGNFSLGLFANYATNTLPYFLQQGEHNDTTKSYNDALTTVDVGFGYGVFDDLDVGIVAPYVVHQHVGDKQGYHGQFAETGNTEVRIGAKLRLWHNDKTGVALVGSANYNRIVDNPYVGDGSKFSYNGELVVDHRIGQAITVAANAGYRIRQSGDPMPDAAGNTPITPVENQIVASGAFKYRFDGGTNLIAEVYGSQPAAEVSEFSPREATTYEAIGGMKQEINKDWAAHVGIGGEIRHSTSSPDFRVYTGVNWTPVEEKKVAKKKKPIPPPPVVVNKVVKKVIVVKPAAVRQPDEQIVLRDVLFPFNSSEISHSAALRSLSDLGRLITGPKGLEKLIIEGHTCAIGKDQYNYELSVKRANAIKDWLVKQYRIEPAKIIAVGFGESRPIASNSTPSGRRLNRRVEFKVYHVHSNSKVAAQ